MFIRYSTSLSTSACITFALLLLMQVLISTSNAPLPAEPPSLLPPVPAPPPEIKPVEATEEVRRVGKVAIQPATPRFTRPVSVETRSEFGLPTGIDPDLPTIEYPVDHALTVLIEVTPNYPLAMARRDIEGYVIVGFTVSAVGLVVDPFVLDSSHKGFERMALQAIERFKFAPRMVDGVGVPVTGQMRKFTFRLED